MSNKELTVEQKVQICLNLIKSGASHSTARYAAKRYGVKLQFNRVVRQKQKVANKQATDSLCLAQGNTEAWLELKDSHAKSSREERKDYRRSSVIFGKVINRRKLLKDLTKNELQNLKLYIDLNKVDYFVQKSKRVKNKAKILSFLNHIGKYEISVANMIAETKSTLRSFERKNLKRVNQATENKEAVKYVSPSVKGLRLEKILNLATTEISGWKQKKDLSKKETKLKSSLFNDIRKIACLLKENALSTLLNATGKARKVVKDFAELVSDHCDMVIDWTLLSE